MSFLKKKLAQRIWEQPGIKRSNLHEYLELMERWGKRTFLVDYKGYRKRQWTYQETLNCILYLSRRVSDYGLGKGDRVILKGRSGPEWVFAFFSILYNGGVVVPLHPESSSNFIKEIISSTNPSLIITDNIIDTQSVNCLLFTEIEKLHQEIKKDSSIPDIGYEKTSYTDLAEIVYTSGTTSQPKGVMLTHKNILSNLLPLENGIDMFKKVVKLITPFKMLCTIPYSHMFGQAAGIFLPILLGSTVFFPIDFSPTSIIKTIKQNKIITLITVPRIMKILKDYVMKELEIRGKLKSFERRWDRWVNLPYPLRVAFFLDVHRIMGLSFWSFITGGAPLDPDTHEFWRRLVFAVFQGYGLTETAPMVTFFNPFKHNRSSVGKVFPGQEIKIAPDGEILIRGNNVMAGYYNDPGETVKVLDGEWFKTGDIGEIDTEGHLFIKGRKKDMMVTSDGHNIYPGDIEQVLNRIEGVRESVVFGIRDNGGEAPFAVLLLEPEVDQEVIIRKANSQLLPFQRIHHYYVWPEPDFPRTSTMKVRKGELFKKVQKDEKAPPGSKLILKHLDERKVSAETTLGDLGMDSLDIVEAVCEVERKYGVSLDETLVGPNTKVGELEKLAVNPPKTRSVTIPYWSRFWLVSFFRRIIMDGFILPVLRLFINIEVQGLENILGIKDGIIFAANHASDMDPVAILLALPLTYRRRLAPALGLNRFHAYFSSFGKVSREEIKKHSPSPMRRIGQGIVYNLITFLFNTFPFPQTAAYRSSLEYTGELADRGYWILIFPEGVESSTGEVQSFKKGISFIAEKTRLKVCPVGISGMHRVLPPGKKFPKRSRVIINFGKPLMYENQGYPEFTATIEKKVKNLILNQDK